MPGSERCARCAASLMLLAAEIDVNPPRASAWQKRLPTLHLAAARHSLDVGRNTAASIFGWTRSQSSFDWSLSQAVSLAVPGLHQIRSGERARGKLFLLVYLAIGLVSVPLLGTILGSVLLGLLLSWHIIATVDAIARGFDSFAQRGLLTALAASVLVTVVYLPPLWLVRSIATPIRIATPTRYFERGDVIWYHPGSDADIGDLVLYEVPPNAGLVRGGSGYPINYRIAGDRINRLVAVAGQTIKIDQAGKLRVDGVVSPWQPAAAGLLARQTEIRLRPDQVLILPENLLPAGIGSLPSEKMIELARMPRDRIRGTIVIRSFPTYRLEVY